MPAYFTDPPAPYRLLPTILQHMESINFYGYPSTVALPPPPTPLPPPPSPPSPPSPPTTFRATHLTTDCLFLFQPVLHLLASPFRPSNYPLERQYHQPLSMRFSPPLHLASFFSPVLCFVRVTYHFYFVRAARFCLLRKMEKRKNEKGRSNYKECYVDNFVSDRFGQSFELSSSATACTF